MTVTLDHRTSTPDWGLAFAQFQSLEGPLENLPLSHPLQSPTRRQFTTTTLQWIQRNVPAAGAQYRFDLGVASRDGNGDHRHTVEGTKLTLVIEMWPSGD